MYIVPSGSSPSPPLPVSPGVPSTSSLSDPPVAGAPAGRTGFGGRVGVGVGSTAGAVVPAGEGYCSCTGGSCPEAEAAGVNSRRLGVGSPGRVSFEALWIR